MLEPPKGALLLLAQRRGTALLPTMVGPYLLRRCMRLHSCSRVFGCLRRLDCESIDLLDCDKFSIGSPSAKLDDTAAATTCVQEKRIIDNRTSCLFSIGGFYLSLCTAVHS